MPLLESLMDALMKTGADYVRLRAEQRIYMLHQGVRREIGRDVISSDRIEKIASDMLGPETASKLDHKPHSIVVQRSGKSFKIVFRRISHVLGIEIQPGTEAEAEKTKAGAALKKPPPAKEAPAQISGAESTLDSDLEEPAVNELLRLMISENASDIHLSAGTRPVLRVDGDIRFLNDHKPMDASQIAAMVREIVPEETFKQFEQDSDADFAYEIPGLARFRINIFADRNGVGIVIRQIPFGIRTAEDIGLQKSVLDLCFLTKGLVLVTGPTGAGKSTTLASLIDHINKNRSGHIITIEDPIEFVHEDVNCLINQREVGTHTQSFKQGAPGGAQGGPGRGARRRDAGPGNDLHRHRNGGNGTPGVRDASYVHVGLHHRPHHRSISSESAGPDPGDALRVSERHHRAGALQENRRRTSRCIRNPVGFPRGLEPH